MPPPATGAPRQSQKPQPIGSVPLVSLFTVCALCALYIFWRRARSIRAIVSHQLKTWTRGEGNIRLSEDEGPPARSFVEDDEDEDLDDEPLTQRIERLRPREDRLPYPPPGS